MVYTNKINAGFTYSYNKTQITLKAKNLLPNTKVPVNYAWEIKTEDGAQTVYTASGADKQQITPTGITPGKYRACLTISNDCTSDEICRPVCISDGIVDCCPSCIGSESN